MSGIQGSSTPPLPRWGLRIAAIKGAAEEYARQGNALMEYGLWGRFGKGGGE